MISINQVRQKRRRPGNPGLLRFVGGKVDGSDAL